MQEQAVKDILRLLPEHMGSFSSMEYPLPVKTIFMADRDLDIQQIRRGLKAKQSGDVKDLIAPLLLAAEICESVMEDREKYFLTDAKVQSYVFSGAKWQAGWVLVLGGEQEKLIRKLKDRGFMVFTDQPGIEDTHDIGQRPTSPIYFLQLMVRYGLVWGRIKPGDDHEMGHFLEKDMPGLIIINEELEPLKYLIALGLMKLGAPAVVPSAFPFPYGNRVVADSVDDIVEKGSRFPNLRVQYYKDEVISLPVFCDPATAKEKFTPALKLGGDKDSFLCVKPARETGARIDVQGEPEKKIGIQVSIRESEFTDDVARTVERVALKALNYPRGVRAHDNDDILSVDFKEKSLADGNKLGDAVYWGIRLQYPRIEKISVIVIFDEKILGTESKKVQEYKQKRRAFIKSMTRENTDEFIACTECRPFSLEHTCIIVPDRLPMCASRTYHTAKAVALFGSGHDPYSFPSERFLKRES
jgi:hypothetical protein